MSWIVRRQLKLDWLVEKRGAKEYKKKKWHFIPLWLRFWYWVQNVNEKIQEYVNKGYARLATRKERCFTKKSKVKSWYSDHIITKCSRNTTLTDKLKLNVSLPYIQDKDSERSNQNYRRIMIHYYYEKSQRSSEYFNEYSCSDFF